MDEEEKEDKCSLEELLSLPKVLDATKQYGYVRKNTKRQRQEEAQNGTKGIDRKSIQSDHGGVG